MLFRSSAGVLGHIETVSRATWVGLEEQAKRFTLAESGLQGIDRTIERVEAAALSLLREKGAALTQLFSTCGVADVEALKDLAERQAGEVYVTLKDWRKLIAENPGLPGIDEARDPLVVTEGKLALEEKVKQQQLELDRLDSQIGRAHV